MRKKVAFFKIAGKGLSCYDDENTRQEVPPRDRFITRSDMQEFYKKALVALIFLVLTNALLACLFIYQSFLTLSVLGPYSNGDRWRYVGNTDAASGGGSSVRFDKVGDNRLAYAFSLKGTSQFPFAAAEMWRYDRKENLAQIDLSKYSTISFVAKCAPANTLMFGLNTFDDKISKPGEFLTYRSPQTYFSCNETGMPVSLDLTRLTIPDWWFGVHKSDLAHHEYDLKKVAKIAFGSTVHSPQKVDVRVEISELTAHGRDYRYIGALAVIVLASFSAFGLWFFRAHARALMASVDSNLTKDLTLVAYRQLTLEPYKDKEKGAILRYISTNYTDADLDLPGVVSATGTNRNKVNEVLRTELGMTFATYLNKLRLTEAARLLAEKNGAAVAEIAYTVGYANVPYFNKLFKEQYGCTPKAFRSLSARQHQPAATSSPEVSPPSEDLPA
ncbi:helix-turn-helix domain-containing protein [Pseudoduganella namucuonensis]|uniref:AraC-type DNA-binding protein n=1 Tax=Pseudoduganella namucuonensis TaxID=1035707 RepID=A0A1I7M778_9BURK|nr:helix-turn-helix transcriptional regulator [Pseudoduganella namucuonensis]SFV17650.1 AraC-type DNA-binding protein [Pseudoduganella namucuonensis]